LCRSDQRAIKWNHLFAQKLIDSNIWSIGLAKTRGHLSARCATPPP
jgi:hypothetical protein